MAKIRLRKGIRIGRVVTKVVVALISLWVGGTIVNEVGAVMNNTASPFYGGLSLIGWTIEDSANGTATTCVSATADHTSAVGTVDDCITQVTGSGVLVVIGIVAIASVVLEFVEFSM